MDLSPFNAIYVTVTVWSRTYHFRQKITVRVAAAVKTYSHYSQTKIKLLTFMLLRVLVRTKDANDWNITVKQQKKRRKRRRRKNCLFDVLLTSFDALHWLCFAVIKAIETMCHLCLSLCRQQIRFRCCANARRHVNWIGWKFLEYFCCCCFCFTSPPFRIYLCLFGF